MKAMILAAGLGTRLKPLTDHMPKALVKVNGRPMLDLTLERLISAGFTDIIVNVHHHARQVIDHLKGLSYPDVTIEVSDESDELLDTGGAILKARWFLDSGSPFLVHNTDVISDIDLQHMFRKHLQKQPLATLAVSERKSSRYFLMDEDLQMHGWENMTTRERVLTGSAPKKLRKMAFSGIHVISPELFQHISQAGKFSIIQTYLQLCGSFPLNGYLHEASSWFDLGKKDQIERAEEYLKKHPEI